MPKRQTLDAEKGGKPSLPHSSKDNSGGGNTAESGRYFVHHQARACCARGIPAWCEVKCCLFDPREMHGTFHDKVTDGKLPL